MEAGIIMDGVRSVFAVLDGFIYFLISVIYDLIRDLASIQLFGGSDYSAFAQKIYGVMGLFMLFKVSFSLLTYIVDPDSFSDKSKGAATIAKNVIIVLVLIILAPFAFDLMTDAQNIILDENIIERFVFGVGSKEDNLDREFQMNEICGDKFATAASDGDFVALTVFSAFYAPSGLDLNTKTGHFDLSSASNSLIGAFDGLSDEDSDTTVSDLYCTTSDDVTVNKNYLISDLYNAESDDIYLINYNWFWSTIAGGAVVFLFLNICIEIAKRTVKLSFLQLIAPIPIISYIDPKSGKDGMFKRWLKQVGSTWASLFIRLLAIYFAVFVISLIGKNLSDMSLWGEVFLIFGCLMFAKELPKVIENLIPGLNMGGAFTLNPLKNIRENMLGSNVVSAAGAGALGFVGGAVSNGVNAFKNRDKMSLLKGIGSTLAGAGAGAAYSAQNGYKNNRIFSSALSGATGGVRRSSMNRNNRSQLAQEGKSWGPSDMVKDWWTDVSGTRNTTGTTSYIKNELLDSLRRTEDYNRVEEQKGRTMTEMSSGRAAAFRSISAETAKSKYNPVTHGIDYSYKYGLNDYAKYKTDRQSEYQNESDYKNISKRLSDANDLLSRLTDELKDARLNKSQNEQNAILDQYNLAISQQKSAQDSFDSYIRTQLATESEFRAFINERNDFDEARSNQSKEKFRQESLQKSQSARKPNK